MANDLIEQFLFWASLNQHSKPATIKRYRAALEDFFAYTNQRPAGIARSDIEKYLGFKKISGKAINTVRIHLVVLRRFFGWYCQEIDSSFSNPAVRIAQIKEEVRLPGVPSPEDVMRLVYAQDLSTFRGRRNAAIISLLADTGIRLSEIEQLKLGNVELRKDHFILLVPRVKSFERYVPFGKISENRFTTEFWAGYYQEMKYLLSQSENDWLFKTDGPTIQGTQLKASAIQAIIYKASERAGLDKRIHPHSLRHYFATYSYINGVDIMRLKQLLGHARTSTTERYIHIAFVITGDILEHTATAGMKAPPEHSGWVKLLKGIIARSEIKNNLNQ